MKVSFKIRTLSSWVFFPLFFAAVAVAGAENEVEQLGEAFEERRAAVTTQHDQQLAKLEAGYLAALNRQLEKVKASGKLEEVLSIRDEIENLKDGKEPLPALRATANHELKQLRKTYDDSRAGIRKKYATSVAELAAKLTEALKAKEVQFTKAGKIELALEAKELREDIEREEGLDVQQSGKEGGADGWIPIKKAKMKVLTESQYPVKWLDAEFLPTLPPAVGKQIEAAGAGETSLMTVAPASVQLTFQKVVTRFRCKALLAEEGDAKFVVTAAGKVVHSVDLKGGGKIREIDIRLPQARELVLSVEINGNQHGDWAVWMNAEAQ